MKIDNWVENVKKLGFQVITVDSDIIEITEDNGQWVANLSVQGGVGIYDSVYDNDSEAYHYLDIETQMKLDILLSTFCDFSILEREKIFNSLVRLPKFTQGTHWTIDKLLELSEDLDLTRLDNFIIALDRLCDDEYNVGYNDCKDDYSRYAQNIQTEMKEKTVKNLEEMKEKIVKNLDLGLDDLKDF